MLNTMLDYSRIVLYFLIAVTGFVLFQVWEKDHPQITVPQTTITDNINSGRYVPSVAPANQTATQVSTTPVSKNDVIPPVQKGQIVNIKTDVLDISIDTFGGDIVEAKLLKYPESLNSKTPFVLLNNDDKNRYIAESGLLSPLNSDNSPTIYTTTQTDYVLSPDQKELVVKLNWSKAGVNVTKIFTFVRDSYEVKVTYEIQNTSNQVWEGNLYTQLMRTNNPPPSHGMMNLTTYFGAAIATAQKPFEKISFKQMQTQNLNVASPGGWAAMIQHYFISAWIPPKDVTSNYYSHITQSGLYTIGMIGPKLMVNPGATLSTNAKLYTGPAVADRLEQASPGLKLTIDYGWFWFFSGIIFWMMQKIYEVVGNWGWSIVIVTIIIKGLFYQLSAKSYRSMSAMKRLQPKIEALKQRYGEDRQKLTQATLELYRQEKVNPMSGCLPMLIQIPVFIALYWVLVESVELRQAPWILWIHDLSQQDPYYILPVLMGVSFFIQQKLNPPPADPVQAKVMMLMPIIFTFLFANFPAGLMLYWFVNNTLSVLQQWHIMRTTNKP